jgi:hypothetical protein
MNEDQPPLTTNFEPSPVSPGPTTTTPPSGPPLKESRADLVLFLGILSLFMCGPIGIVAWIIANADLKKIRAGTLSPRKASNLKIGRTLGIVGAVLFIGTVVAVTLFVQRNMSGLEEMLGGEPLKSDEFVFAGEWFGERGTYIRIYLDGKGDFISSHSRVRGGRVRISGNSLSIGLLGMSKSWRLDRRPHMENGYWTMRLDGELFKRKGDDFTVKLHQYQCAVTQVKM